MAGDHLDREISVSAALIETGVKASAKSRTVAAFDRLGGNIVDAFNVAIERRTTPERTIIEGKKKLLDAAINSAVERIGRDPAFADRVIAAQAERLVLGQQNKDAVMAEALEDLRRQPPDEQQSSIGGEKLDDRFLNRFERYAEEATADDLRQKWGRVLASEIRTPGTFSEKVMRIVDEMDGPTAKQFEEVCEWRLADGLPLALTGELPFPVRTQLVNAGLLIEPGLGHVVRSGDAMDGDGTKVKIFRFGGYALSVLADFEFTYVGKDAILKKRDDGISMPSYILTPEGAAIATILPDQQTKAIAKLAAKIIEQFTPQVVRDHRFESATRYTLVQKHYVPKRDDGNQ
jgi:hypothetical protein